METNDLRRLELFSAELQRTLMLSVERGGLTCRMFFRGQEVARATAQLVANGSSVWMFETGFDSDSPGVELGINGATFVLTQGEAEKVSALLGVAVVSYEELVNLCLE